jgi:hypothetical protein
VLTAVIAVVGPFELLLGLVELVVRIFHMGAGRVERLGQIIDCTGVTGVELVGNLPGIATGGTDQLIRCEPPELWSVRQLAPHDERQPTRSIGRRRLILVFAGASTNHIAIPTTKQAS